MSKRTKRLPKGEKPAAYYDSLEYQLCHALLPYAGERGQPNGEGALETLERIIRERNAAFQILALDRLKQHHHSAPWPPPF
jgi:hypothetical protein